MGESSEDVGEPRAPLRALGDAVQEFSNSLCQDQSQAGVVVNALVIWEEMCFDAEGKPLRRIFYAVPTDNFSISATVGLAFAGLNAVKEDAL